MYISAGGLRPDDGVMLWYGKPGEVALRQELVVIHGEANAGLVAGAAEYRNVQTYPLFGNSVSQNYDEVMVSGGPAAKLPVLGGVKVGLEWSSGNGGSLAPSAEGKLLGAQVSVQPNQAMIGFVPDVGPGGRVGAEWNWPQGRAFLTSRGYLNEVGGVDRFGKRHAPGMGLTQEYYQSGFWGSNGKWMSGLDWLRFIAKWKWQIPYEEQPQ